MYVPGVTPVPSAAAGAGLVIGAAVTAESMQSMVKNCMYMDMVSVLVVNLIISIMLAEDCQFLVDSRLEQLKVGSWGTGFSAWWGGRGYSYIHMCSAHSRQRYHIYHSHLK